MTGEARLPFISSAAFDVVAMAASAGGFGALSAVLSELDSTFPVPIVVVQHLDRRHRSLMPDLLARRTSLEVIEAEASMKLRPATVFIGPSDHHLLVNADGTLSLTQTELVHFVRPSADLLFESVAGAYRARAIAVVLSGSGVDGAMGLRAVKTVGGTTLVQSGAEFAGMPDAAIDTGSVDFILPLEEIAGALRALVTADEA